MKNANGVGNPLVVAAVSKGVQKTKEKAAATKAFIIKNKRPIGYVAAGAAAFVVVRTAVNRYNKAQAMKSEEAKNANAVYLIIKDKLPKSFFNFDLSLSNLVDHLLPIESSIYDAAKNLVSDMKEDTILTRLKAVKPHDVALLKKTYQGLFRRDLDKDLMSQKVMEGNQYYELMQFWAGSDIKNTGFKVNNNTDKSIDYIDHDGVRKKVKIGKNPALANMYAVCWRKTTAYILSSNGSSLKQTPTTLQKYTFLGQAGGFKISTSYFDGGLIFVSSDKRSGIHLIFKDGIKTTFLVVPIADCKFFSSLANFKKFATGKTIAKLSV